MEIDTQMERKTKLLCDQILYMTKLETFCCNIILVYILH